MLALSSALSSCASIISESVYPVAIHTKPQGVIVSIKDENGNFVHEGKTPFMIMLPASNGYFDAMEYTVHYGAASSSFGARVDGWYAVGNLMFGGPIGWLFVDPATGAMWKLPRSITFRVKGPRVTTSPSREDGIQPHTQ